MFILSENGLLLKSLQLLGQGAKFAGKNVVRGVRRNPGTTLVGGTSAYEIHNLSNKANDTMESWKDAAKEVKNQTSNLSQKIENGIESSANNVSDVWKKVEVDGKEMYQNVKDGTLKTIDDYTKTVTDKATEYKDIVTNKVDEFKEKTKEKVDEIKKNLKNESKDTENNQEKEDTPQETQTSKFDTSFISNHPWLTGAAAAATAYGAYKLYKHHKNKKREKEYRQNFFDTGSGIYDNI